MLGFKIYYRSNIIEALEWLTEHQNDPEDDNDDEYFDFMSAEEGNDKNIFSLSIYTTKILEGLKNMIVSKQLFYVYILKY